MSEETEQERQQASGNSFQGDWPFLEGIQDQSTPTTFRTITGALPGGRRLICPLRVAVEYDDGEVIVSEPLFHNQCRPLFLSFAD
ncbi:MAG TPA: hypothetical protein VNG51_26335 [Ktedonobacteraceae bacterium]|nr:hypothetical protein [Ktedonobacteraceae bacterium]